MRTGGYVGGVCGKDTNIKTTTNCSISQSITFIICPMYKHNTPQIPRQNRQKNYLISNLRVLAILLVVLGHSIIIYDPNWTTYNTPFHSVFLVTLKKIINLFQMELFFSLSGFLFFYTTQKKFKIKSLLKKKTITLANSISSHRIILPYSNPVHCKLSSLRKHIFNTYHIFSPNS